MKYVELVLKKYDDSRKDMLVHGFDNIEGFKIEINLLLEKSFDEIGIHNTMRIYNDYVRKY